MGIFLNSAKQEIQSIWNSLNELANEAILSGLDTSPTANVKSEVYNAKKRRDASRSDFSSELGNKIVKYTSQLSDARENLRRTENRPPESKYVDYKTGLSKDTSMTSQPWWPGHYEKRIADWEDNKDVLRNQITDMEEALNTFRTGRSSLLGAWDDIADNMMQTIPRTVGANIDPRAVAAAQERGRQIARNKAQEQGVSVEGMGIGDSVNPSLMETLRLVDLAAQNDPNFLSGYDPGQYGSGGGYRGGGQENMEPIQTLSELQQRIEALRKLGVTQGGPGSGDLMLMEQLLTAGTSGALNIEQINTALQGISDPPPTPTDDGGRRFFPDWLFPSSEEDRGLFQRGNRGPNIDIQFRKPEGGSWLDGAYYAVPNPRFNESPVPAPQVSMQGSMNPSEEAREAASARLQAAIDAGIGPLATGPYAYDALGMDPDMLAMLDVQYRTGEGRLPEGFRDDSPSDRFAISLLPEERQDIIRRAMAGDATMADIRAYGAKTPYEFDEATRQRTGGQRIDRGADAVRGTTFQERAFAGEERGIDIGQEAGTTYEEKSKKVADSTVTPEQSAARQKVQDLIQEMIRTFRDSGELNFPDTNSLINDPTFPLAEQLRLITDTFNTLGSAQAQGLATEKFTFDMEQAAILEAERKQELELARQELERKNREVELEALRAREANRQFNANLKFQRDEAKARLDELNRAHERDLQQLENSNNLALQEFGLQQRQFEADLVDRDRLYELRMFEADQAAAEADRQFGLDQQRFGLQQYQTEADVADRDRTFQLQQWMAEQETADQARRFGLEEQLGLGQLGLQQQQFGLEQYLGQNQVEQRKLEADRDFEIARQRLDLDVANAQQSGRQIDQRLVFDYQQAAQRAQEANQQLQLQQYQTELSQPYNVAVRNLLGGGAAPIGATPTTAAITGLQSLYGGMPQGQTQPTDPFANIGIPAGTPLAGTGATATAPMAPTAAATGTTPTPQPGPATELFFNAMPFLPGMPNLQQGATTTGTSMPAGTALPTYAPVDTSTIMDALPGLKKLGFDPSSAQYGTPADFSSFFPKGIPTLGEFQRLLQADREVMMGAGEATGTSEADVMQKMAGVTPTTTGMGMPQSRRTKAKSPRDLARQYGDY